MKNSLMAFTKCKLTHINILYIFFYMWGGIKTPEGLQIARTIPEVGIILGTKHPIMFSLTIYINYTLN